MKVKDKQRSEKDEKWEQLHFKNKHVLKRSNTKQIHLGHRRILKGIKSTNITAQGYIQLNNYS